MTFMNKKKNYTVPTFEIFEFEGESLLLGSPTKNLVVDNNTEEAAAPGGEGGNYGDAWMSNKKDPWQHTWE